MFLSIMLIQEKEVIKRIQVFCSKGRNAGKQTGEIIFEKNREPYYLVWKNWRRDQLYQAPKHRNTLSISEHILILLEKYGVKKVVFGITGFEERAFYYIVLLKEFWEGERTEYDDTQYRIWTNNLFRYYPEQENIGRYL